MKLLRSQRGDTIVEVLIVVAVIGQLLAISFVTVNRSVSYVRQSEESSSAAGYVQSQVEALRSLAATAHIRLPSKWSAPAPNDDKNIFKPTTGFCIPDPTA